MNPYPIMYARKLFFTVNIFFLSLTPAWAELTLHTRAGNLVKTQEGSIGFSTTSLYALFRYPKGYTAVQAASARLLSGRIGMTLKGYADGASVYTEYTPMRWFSAGVYAGLTDAQLKHLNITLDNIVIREQDLKYRFYHTGVAFAVPPLKIRYDGRWYWGKAGIGLHDFAAFIAQPTLNYTATVHKLHITNWYECSAVFLRLRGTLYNRTAEKIASGSGNLIEIKNTVHIPTAGHSHISLFASYIYFTGSFAVRLTAENQGYFLFPYRFYHRDILLSGSALGFGGTYTYTSDRFGFSGTALLYSVIHDAGSDRLHSKEKKSFIFKGKEERQTASLLRITGSNLVLLRFSFRYRLTEYLDISAGKTVPLPILSKPLSNILEQAIPSSVERSGFIIDPFFTGLSIQISLRL